MYGTTSFLIAIAHILGASVLPQGVLLSSLPSPSLPQRTRQWLGARRLWVSPGYSIYSYSVTFVQIVYYNLSQAKQRNQYNIIITRTGKIQLRYVIV